MVEAASSTIMVFVVTFEAVVMPCIVLLFMPSGEACAPCPSYIAATFVISVRSNVAPVAFP
jgi:hypothetical protein